MIIKIRLGLVSMTRSYFKLNSIPFVVKFYIGFVLFGFLLIGLVSLHAYIKRPEQIQKLLVYEQKLASISVHKVSEEHFATGKNGQIYVFKKTYKSVTLESVKNILAEEKINWREVNKSHLIGYDVDDSIWVEIIRDINTNSIIVKLEKDR